MDDLKAKLEQNKRKIKKVELERDAADSLSVDFAQYAEEHRVEIEELKVLGAVIEAEIAATEVTYSIGDRFVLDTGGERMLVEAEELVYMISLESGKEVTGFGPVKDRTAISLDEMSDNIDLDQYTRTYDARKQCKC